jgi:hypothetical protein
MTDFRALCEELLRSLENYPVQPLRDRDLCIRARAALARWGTSNLAEIRSSLGDHQLLVEDDVDLYLEQ